MCLCSLDYKVPNFIVQHQYKMDSQIYLRLSLAVLTAIILYYAKKLTGTKKNKREGRK